MGDEERSLDEGAELYRLLVESAKDYAIFMLDPEGRVKSWNEGARRIKGYRRDEILGRHFSVFYPEEDAERGRPEEVLRLAAAEGRYEEEGPRVRKDGSGFWASVVITPLRDEAGRLRGFAKVVRDITERKNAEERTGFLADLDRALQPLVDPDEVTAAAARMLGEHLKADRCAYAEVEEDEDHFRIVGDYARGVPSITGRFAMSAFGAEALRLMREDESYVVYDAEADGRVSAADLAAYRQTRIRAVVGVALHKAGRFVAGMAVHQKGPRRWSDEEVGLVETVAERCWESMERARAVRGLRESEERYRTLFESIDEGFCLIESLFDEDGKPIDYRFLEINPAFEKHTGLEGAVGRRVRELVPDIEAQWVEIYGEVALTGEPVRFENRAEAMGRRFDVHAFRVGRPQSRRVALLFKDITARKEAEEALRESEGRLRDILDNSPTVVYAKDPEGRYLMVNRRFEELFGVGRDEAVGKTDHEIFPEEAAERFRANDEEVLRSGAPLEAEEAVPQEDGEHTYLSVKFPLRDASGTLYAVCGISADITGRRRAEEELDGIRQAERRRISRDLHDGVLQDLAGALQALQLTRLRAERSGLDLDLSEEVEALRRAAGGLRGAVHDLRLQAERPFVRAVEDLVESERRLDPEREVDLSVPEGFPEELPEALGSELLRVLREALTNARKHSGAGRVEVVLSVGGGRVQVEVADDGRGFGPGETSETAAGGGVGLSTMRERVEALGGEIEIRSRPGEGTRVTATVPFS